MVDPTDALISFQQALKRGDLRLQRCELDPALYVLADKPNGELRLSYARLDGKTVTALVLFVNSQPLDGKPCFNIGYAVPAAFRRKGLATSTVQASIAELRNGFGRNGIKTFYVEAVVGTTNEASKGVAASTLSPDPKSIIDEVSGEPALHYVRKVEA